MAAFDTPWMRSMSTITPSTPQSSFANDPYATPPAGGQPLTHATFSPASSTYSPTLFKQRQTIIVHQKSPLLLATPPQITRALSYSHPFLLPLNKLAGLITWTSQDPWESFLLVAGFWAITIYGDQIIRYAGPVLIVIALIMGMYSRRFSPLSSSWANAKEKASKHRRGESEAAAVPGTAGGQGSTGSITRHQKSLDEVVETLKIFTTRCNILLDPFLRLTDFLSTQRTATTTSTRASLMTLFIRIVLVTPLWYLLTLPPLCIITTRRVILTIGTIVLSWHSRPARVSRVVLWRSRSVRRSVAFLTGLDFPDSSVPNAAQSAAAAAAEAAAAKYKSSKSKSDPLLIAAQKDGVRFTFSLWENQRRWLGIGWTTSMLGYERTPWTDEELNPAPPKEKFQLPAVEGGVARWRWVEGSRWTIEGVDDEDDDEETESDEANDTTTENVTVDENSKPQTVSAAARKQSDSDKASIKTTASKASQASKKSTSSTSKSKAYSDDGGWIYCDTKWRFPRRGVDGWGKYTRRRKWLRDAELVEITPASTPSVEQPPTVPQTPSKSSTAQVSLQQTSKQNAKQGATLDDASSTSSKSRHGGGAGSGGGGGGWFSRSRGSSKASTTSSGSTVVDPSNDNGSFSLAVHESDRTDYEDDGYVPMPYRGRQGPLEREWGMGDDGAMELG